MPPKKATKKAADKSKEIFGLIWVEVVADEVAAVKASKTEPISSEVAANEPSKAAEPTQV